MAVDVTLSTISSGYNVSGINTNFQNVSDGLEDALSRSGNGPNQMSADIDMGGNDILNGGTATFAGLVVGDQDLSSIAADLATADTMLQDTIGEVNVLVGQAQTAATQAQEAAGTAVPMEQQIHNATSKTPLVDSDEFGIADSAASYGVKKALWSTIKNTFFTALGSLVAAGTNKATPIDADSILVSDSASSGATRNSTFTNLKAFFKTYFDTLYAAVSHTHTFASLTSKPTTIAGYGITDAAGSIAPSSPNGYIQLPNGVMFQWGTYTGGSASATVTYSANFPTAAVGVYTTTISNSGSVYSNTISSVNRSNFSFTHRSIGSNGFFGPATDSFNWIAIGY